MPSDPAPAAPRIYLSYARTDRDELIAAGLTVWHDLQNLEAGQWWSQIAGALDGTSIEHIVLITSARPSRQGFFRLGSGPLRATIRKIPSDEQASRFLVRPDRLHFGDDRRRDRSGQHMEVSL
jgi:hypothetical protein